LLNAIHFCDNIYRPTLGFSSLSLSHHQVGKFSITARPGADSEIVNENNDGAGGYSSQRGLRHSPFGRFGVKPPELNTFTYLRVNFACIFAHICGKSVSLLHLQTPVGLHHPHSLACICPWVRLDYTVTVLCIFIATVFAVGTQLGKLLSLTLYRLLH